MNSRFQCEKVKKSSWLQINEKKYLMVLPTHHFLTFFFTSELKYIFLFELFYIFYLNPLIEPSSFIFYLSLSLIKVNINFSLEVVYHLLFPEYQSYFKFHNHVDGLVSKISLLY